MKITIDTQVDTYDDIKKVLHILHSILERGNASLSSPLSNETAAADTGNLMKMFDDTPVAKDVPDTPPDFSSFLNLVNKKQEGARLGSPTPKIELY
jgi:hypothetical protein